MATVTTLPAGARVEHRGLTYWMDRVLKELDVVCYSPDADSVHDLRVAIRRCRSIASAMEEVDPHPAWHQTRKVARKLFRGLGALRDAQVMEDWVKHVGAESDPLRAELLAMFEGKEQQLREEALYVAERFDQKAWKRLSRTLRQRVRLVPPGSLVAECFALERYQEAKELHANALRTEKAKPWHALRIGLKRFRYTVENLLPEHHAAWSDKLKRVQDLLGEVHDLDVLAGVVKEASSSAPQSREAWLQTMERERRERIQKYRQLTLGKTSLWNEWRHALPHGERLEAASMARLRATARAAGAQSRRTSQTSHIAVALFQKFGRVKAGPVFSDPRMLRVLCAAAQMHGVSASDAPKARQKAARRFLLGLTIPPGWSTEEWALVAWAVRYHRGAEPRSKRGAFAKLNEIQQRNIRALAGTLRLARALRKCGITSPVGLRAEKSIDAILLRVPGLRDSAETAARLAAGKHLVESCLDAPLLLVPAGTQEKVLALPTPDPQVPLFFTAASD
jgi:CHAD domain-containing protein